MQATHRQAEHRRQSDTAGPVSALAGLDLTMIGIAALTNGTKRGGVTLTSRRGYYGFTVLFRNTLEGDCDFDPPTEPPQTAAAMERAEAAMRVLCMALAAAGLLVNAAVLCALLCGGGNDGGDGGSPRLRRRRGSRTPWLPALLGSLCVADALLADSTIALLGFVEHDGSVEHEAHINVEADGKVASMRRVRDEYCAVELLGYVWDFATTANLLTLAAIAVNLFAASRWPLPYGGNGSRRCCLRRPAPAAATTLAVIWLISAAGALLPAALVAMSVPHEHLDLWSAKTSSPFCYQLILYAQPKDSRVTVRGGGSKHYKYDFGQQSHERAHLLFGMTLTASALLAIVVSYVYVLRAVRGSRTGGDAEARATRTSLPMAAGGGGSWRRLAVVAAVVTLLFLVCYLPLCTLHTLAIFYDWRIDAGEHGGLVYAALMAAAALAPVVDPLLYALRVREIRAALSSVFLPRRLRRHERRKLAAAADETVESFVALERARDDDGRESLNCGGGVSAEVADHSRL